MRPCLGAGTSVTRASVVRIMAAMEQAFSKALRVTLTGSMIRLRSDLGDAAFDGLGQTVTTYQGRVFLGADYLVGLAQIVQLYG